MEALPDGIVVPQAAAVATVLRLNSNAQVAASGTVRKLTVAACKKAYSNLVLGPRAVPDVGEVRPFVRIGLYDHTPLPLEGCVFLALYFSRRGTLLQVLVVAVTGHSYEPTEHASSATFSSRRKTVADAFLRVSGLLRTAHYNVATAWEGCRHVTVGKPRVRVRCRCECVASTTPSLGPFMSAKAKGGAERHQAPAQLGPTAACRVTRTPGHPPTHPPPHKHCLRRHVAGAASSTVAPRSHWWASDIVLWRHASASTRLN